MTITKINKNLHSEIQICLKETEKQPRKICSKQLVADMC